MEERILIPLLLRTLSEAEWARIWRESDVFGWCLVEPGDEYRPAPSSPDETVGGEADGVAALPTGRLTREQLQGILEALPIEITFVDAEGRVRFFSPARPRLFPRVRTILGRKVQDCHPARSRRAVTRILDDFRAGRHRTAEFWMIQDERFVHVRFLAVRSEAGEYLGTLEVAQDVTRVRQLQGEQRGLLFDPDEDA